MVQGWTSGKDSKYIRSFLVSYGTERKSLRLYEDFAGIVKVGGKECYLNVIEEQKMNNIHLFIHCLIHTFIYFCSSSQMSKSVSKESYIKYKKGSIFFLFCGFKSQMYNFTFVQFSRIITCLMLELNFDLLGDTSCS